MFPLSDLHWAVHGWAKVAPGLGGWTISVAVEGDAEVVHVIPPTPLADPLSAPHFVLAVDSHRNVILAQALAGEPGKRLATFANLAEALHALCPLTAEQETEADEMAEAALRRL